MKITARVLGEVEIGDEQVIEMHAGMVGFSSYHSFALVPLSDDPEVPFLCWQCIDDPSLCFILIDPALVDPDYEVAVPSQELESIELKSASEGSVYVVVTIPADPKQMTVNLMGPVVINQSARKAKQLVLADPRFTTKHRVMREGASGHACADSKNQ